MEIYHRLAELSMEGKQVPWILYRPAERSRKSKVLPFLAPAVKIQPGLLHLMWYHKHFPTVMTILIPTYTTLEYLGHMNKYLHAYIL